jgi:hypothetical protein
MQKDHEKPARGEQLKGKDNHAVEQPPDAFGGSAQVHVSEERRQFELLTSAPSFAPR